jgi:hypothetical protein
VTITASYTEGSNTVTAQQIVTIQVDDSPVPVTGIVRLRPQVLIGGFDPIRVDLNDTSFKLFAIARPGALPIQNLTTRSNSGGFSMAMTNVGTYDNGDQRFETTFSFVRGAFPSETVLGDLFGSSESKFQMSVVDSGQQTHSFPNLEFGNNVALNQPVTSPRLALSEVAGIRRLIPQVLGAGLDPQLVDLDDTSFDVIAIVRAGVVPIQTVSITQNQGGFALAMVELETLPNGDKKYRATYTYPRGAFPETRLGDLFGTQPGQFNITVTDQTQQTHSFPNLGWGNNPAL